MKLRLGLIIGVGAAALLAAGAARAQTSPFIGKWQWNKSLSRVPPGGPPPASIVMQFSSVAASDLKWSVTTTDPQGHAETEQFDAPADGQFHPISGGATAAFRIGPMTLGATFKAPTGDTDALNCALSPDQRRMTCNGTMTEKAGKSMTYMDVYDKN